MKTSPEAPKQASDGPRAVVESHGQGSLSGPWPAVTIALFIVGYAGYYLCRSDLAVARPLIMDQFKGIGVTKEWIGGFTSIATLMYAIGKFFFGSVADIVGGRRMFLLGMGGAILFTLLFGFGGPPLFLIAWCGNRFIQSSGWVGMVKTCSKWFGHTTYGTVMGLVSLSFLFGDFASRVFLGNLISRGWTWQQIFYISAGVLAVIFIPTFILLRETPHERGLPDPEANPESVFAAHDADSQRRSLKELLLPLLTSQRFWIVCILSFGFTFMRETFNDWIPTFLHEMAKMKEGEAAKASGYFPLLGGFSVIGVGYLSDRLKHGGRAAIITLGLLLSTIGILVLAYGGLEAQPTVYVALTALIAFVLIGPYSFLAGAVAMDFGGKQGSATSAGWIDGIGYIGGILSGSLIGKIAERSGWHAAFLTLALTAFLSFLVAAVYWRQEISRKPAIA